MIPPAKHGQALRALNGLLVHARWMAGERVPFKDLYDFLDSLEHLPRYLAGAADDTERFRRSLVEICQRFACARVLQDFDGPLPKTW